MARLSFDAGEGGRARPSPWRPHLWRPSPWRRSAWPASRSPEATLAVAVAAITLAGLALRLAAARDDLWLDEIWSFRLVEGVRRAADIILALPYDNNHVLNSLWLRLVDPGASSPLVRLPAIVMGTLCVPVAARIGVRRGPIAALAAAVIFALDQPFVQFGSEARGYAGMILATLVALDALDRLLSDQPRSRDLLTYAAAVALGTFSHLTMLEPVLVLSAVALLRLGREEGWRASVLHRARPILIATAAGLAPPLGCLAITLAPGTLHTGLVTPFDPWLFAEGLGRLVRATIGVPDRSWSRAAILGQGLVVGCGCVAAIAILPAERRVLPALAIIGLPALHWAVHLPNPEYPRFYITTGIGLALLGAEVWARAWDGPPIARLAAGVAALGFLAAQGTALHACLTAGHGHYADAVAFMRANGAARFAVQPSVNAGETAAIVRWYAPEREGADLVLAGDGCAEPSTPPPTWLIVVRTPDKDAGAERSTCGGRHYALARTFPAHGFSGFVWSVFRLVDPDR